MAFFQTGNQTYSTPFNSTTDKTIVNSAAETSLIPSGMGTVMLTPNWFAPGRSARIIMSGIYSTATVIGNATFRVYLGGSPIASGVLASLVSLTSNQEWGLNVTISCRSTGTSGSVMAGGSVWYQTGMSTRLFQGISPLSPTTVDTTQALQPDVTFQWSSALLANSISTKIMTMELLQP